MIDKKPAAEEVISILNEWDIDEKYFTDVVRDNPSLRGMILGYVA